MFRAPLSATRSSTIYFLFLRFNLRRAIADSEAELATMCSALGERPKRIRKIALEVSRLEELKVSKLKELVLRKRSELEEICRKTHLLPESDNLLEISIEAIEKGVVDLASILEEIEVQIGKVKEEAFSRLDILEKVEKWLAACEEKTWLEEYNMDENRYNTGKGTHLVLQRAEKARALVGKLPGISEALVSKTRSWESERGSDFNYDDSSPFHASGVLFLSQEKEKERKRLRDQMRLQGQLTAEKEVLFGSKPNSPMKQQGLKKASKLSSHGGSFKRLFEGMTMKSPKADLLQISKATPTTTRLAKRNDATSLNEPSESGDSTNSNDEDSNTIQNETPLKTDYNGNVQDEEDNMTSNVVQLSAQSIPRPLSKPIEADSEEIEKSFEERRADFVLSQHA